MVQKKNRKTSSDKIAKAVLAKAWEWAKENGIKGEISISAPVKEAWGWWVDISGSEEKDRTAHASFDRAGNPTIWEKHV